MEMAMAASAAVAVDGLAGKRARTALPQGNSKSSELKHKITHKALWMNVRLNPSWLQSEPATSLNPQTPKLISSSTSSSSTECSQKSRTIQAWEESFSDPSQWWDNRSEKRNLRIPDFKHKTANRALWIGNKLNPSWVYSRLAAMGQCQGQGQSGALTSTSPGHAGRVVRIERLWQEFFVDPSQWWDNRSIKKSSKHPDFEHRTTHECLYIEGWLNPSWVKAKFAAMSLGHTNSGGGSIGRVPKLFCDGVDVRKLCEGGRLKEAIHMVELVVQGNIKAPMNVCVSLLKGCIKRKALEEGKRVHSLIVHSGLDSHIYFGKTLVVMYAKCGSLLDARKVFDTMPEHNVFSWTAIISAYSDHGQGKEALKLFQKMQQTGIAPDKVAFIVVLKACAMVAALELGKQLHCDIVERGLESDLIVGNTLVDMYAKCGCIEHARLVFDKMCERDVVSWSTMISGYGQNGVVKEAIGLYEQMKQEGVQPNNVTYIVLLKACASMAALEQGKQLHSHIIRGGFESDLIIGNTLVDMYAKCGCIDHAHQVFTRMSGRDVVSWNAMIAGYSQHGHCKEAFALYEQMKQEGVQPSIITYVVLLNACAGSVALEQGKQLHSHIIESGFELDLIIGNSLVDMYAKCGCIEPARQIFNKISERDVVSWNTILTGYEQHGLWEETFDLYEQMKQENVQPDNVTYVILLKACGSCAALELGKQLHSHIARSGIELDVIVGNTLVDMYSKCGCIELALKVFNRMSERNLVSWSAMIAGYVQNGLAKEALSLYEQMKQKNVEPDSVTYAILLKACASIPALEQGKKLHSHIITSGFESDVIVGNTLVDMYAKCGLIEHARKVFVKMSEQNVISWSSMIVGYAQQGLGKEALMLLEQMKKEGLMPDEVTYVCVLSACSHSGLVDEGRQIFDSMCEDHGVTPTMQHYACMVDLLGRAGSLADAENFIQRMPIQPDVVVWVTLLSAARNHGNVELGRRAFDHIVKLDPGNAAAYVLLSNIYAAAGKTNEAAKLKKQMKSSCEA